MLPHVDVCGRGEAGISLFAYIANRQQQFRKEMGSMMWDLSRGPLGPGE